MVVFLCNWFKLFLCWTCVGVCVFDDKLVSQGCFIDFLGKYAMLVSFQKLLLFCVRGVLVLAHISVLGSPACLMD